MRPSYHDLLNGAIHNLRRATKFLTNQSEQDPVISVALLRAIAEARYGLIVTSNIIYNVANQKQRDDSRLARQVSKSKEVDKDMVSYLDMTYYFVICESHFDFFLTYFSIILPNCDSF